MRYLNHTSVLKCSHGGTVVLAPTPAAPEWQTDGVAVLTEKDLRSATVNCPQCGPGISPCKKVPVVLVGQVTGVTVGRGGEVPLLESVVGLTDGNPPGFCVRHDPGTAQTAVTVRPVAGAGPNPAPPGSRQTIVVVTAKSFIAWIGGNVGHIPGETTVFIPGRPAPIPVMVSRQTLLRAMGLSLDAMMREDPQTDAIGGGYRLLSQCRFTVTNTDTEILAVTASPLTADVGTEGPLHPGDLIISPVTVDRPDPPTATFAWYGTGRPHKLVEPGFDKIKPRTSVYIWHDVRGRLSVVGGVVRTSVTITGSQFPSHRVFVDGEPVQTVMQGPLSNLWVADDLLPVRVR